MTYTIWLICISLVFTVAERIWPRRAFQRMLRKGIRTDLAYVVFNGHFLGLALAGITTLLSSQVGLFLSVFGINLDLHVARQWPFLAQLLSAFVLIDLVQWGIHNLMHRIPWFWEFHKVHHSISELDWLGSLKFHWIEVILYKSLQYPLLAILGFEYKVLFILAVLSTFIGHYNHSNFSLDLGVLKYVFNSPQMHEWHHVHPDAGPANKNFGINLSLWDWMFGSAYLPADRKSSPPLLGFRDMGNFPKSMVFQELWPLHLLGKNLDRFRSPPVGSREP